MSRSSQPLPYLRPEAFTGIPNQSAVDTKQEDKKPITLYPSGVAYVGTYPVLRLIKSTYTPAELQQFREQLDTLLDPYISDSKNAGYSDDIVQSIKTFQEIRINYDALPNDKEKSNYLTGQYEQMQKALLTLQQPFRQQFNVILDQFMALAEKIDKENVDEINKDQTLTDEEKAEKIARIAKCNTPLRSAQIALLRSNIFEIGYSGSQLSSGYFAQVKKNIENLYLALQDQTIPLNKRQDFYKQSCSIFGMCSAGLAIHLQNLIFSFYTPLSLKKVLVALRTDIIQAYANIHNVAKGVTEGNSVHTEGFFAQYAEDLGWTSALSTKDITDDHLTSTYIEAEDIEKLSTYFQQEYTPTAIRSRIDAFIRSVCLMERVEILCESRKTPGADWGRELRRRSRESLPVAGASWKHVTTFGV